MTANGHCFERSAIEEWLRSGSTRSPLTNATLEHTHLTPAHTLRKAIEEWEAANLLSIRREDIVMDRQIGAGSFKTVYRGTLKIAGAPTPMTVAVLKMRRGTCTSEAAVFQKLGRHPRLLKFYGQCIDGDDQLLVTEYVQRGSLSDAFEDIEAQCTMDHKAVMLLQIGQVMEALNEHELIHRNLAPRNVMLKDFMAGNPSATSVKVADFGLTVGAYDRTHMTLSLAEKPIRYLPPESLQRDRYSEKSDVWAFGVTGWEILTNGMVPYFELTTDSEVVKFVCGGGRLPMPDGCPPALWSVLLRCMAAAPAERPTFTQLGVLLAGTVGAPTQPTPAQTAALLDGWTEQFDLNYNRAYYFNARTGQAQWERPS